jgi:hypothetical protein
MGLWQHRLTMVVGAFCVCTFIASLFFHVFICEPVHSSWQIKPYPGGETDTFRLILCLLTPFTDNCTIRPLNYIVIESLSITSVTDLSNPHI